MSATKKLDVRFVIKVGGHYAGSDYETFSGDVTYMETPTDFCESGLHNPCSWDDPPIAALADLRITAQRDRRGTTGPWYGCELRYRDVFEVDLVRAKLMVKTLTIINRKMDRLAEQLGYPVDLADFCARCAIVLGATSKAPFGVWHPHLTYNGTHYRWVDVNGLRNHLAPVKADA